MPDSLPDSGLMGIEQHAMLALDIAPGPWGACLETRGAIGGCSYVQCGDDPAVDNEIYVDVHLGSERLTSPDAGLDAVVDFVAHAPADIARLIAEIRRLRGEIG